MARAQALTTIEHDITIGLVAAEEALKKERERKAEVERQRAEAEREWQRIQEESINEWRKLSNGSVTQN